MTGGTRQEDLARALAAVHRRIVAACATADRDPAQVTLIVVTKTYPATDVRLLAGLGARHVGESRDQEAGPKAAETADLELVRHFVGRLQGNKARSVAGYTDVVHSVDRSGLVAALGRGAAAAGRRVACFVQVSLDGDPARGGASPADLPGIAELVAADPALDLLGVMAVAPVSIEPAAAFARLWEVSLALRRDHPTADRVSAGMSGDLEDAVRHGATHLRVGSAVLGARPALG